MTCNSPQIRKESRLQDGRKQTRWVSLSSLTIRWTASVASQWNDLREFIMAQSPNTAVAVAYASNSEAKIAQDFTTDHALAAKALRIPLGRFGAGSSPYFAVIDWLKRWPEYGHPSFSFDYFLGHRLFSWTVGSVLSRLGHCDFPCAARECQSLEHLFAERRASQPFFRAGQPWPE